MTKDYNEQKFLEDSKTRFACVFQLQVIGEACKNLSGEIKEKYNNVK